MLQNHYRLGYRADIEGLRAVAVLLVIASHAGVPGLSGGFIGVDAFFVLSGYLITGLLISEFSDRGTIDFLGFYSRRFKRLAPGLLLMLLVTSVFVYLTIAPSDQSAHYLAAASAALWVSNLHFIAGDLSYFSPDVAENLYLHTWSLSVEEQFYLVWPALIFFILSRVGGRIGFSAGTRMARIFLGIAAASFALAFYLSYSNAIAAYYLPFSRVWQFAVGALALLVTFRLRNGITGITQESQTGHSIAMQSSGWLGLGVLVLFAFVLSKDFHYPGAWALAPTLGTALVLVAGAAPGQWGVSRFLATRPMVLIGNLSYSWYLWHWPVLALARILNPVPSPAFTLGAVVVSFVLAGLSYYLVEQPVRRNGLLSQNPRLIGALSICAMVLVVIWQFWLLDSSQRNIGSPILEKLYAARNDMPVIYSLECDDWTESSDLKPCEFGSDSPTHEAILIGDSISGQWFSAFYDIAQRAGWRITVFTKSSCPLVDQPYFYQRIGRRFRKCEVWREKLLEEIALRSPDLVLMSSSVTYPFSQQQWEQGTSSVLQKIVGHVDRTIIIRSTPALPFDALSCARNQAWQQQHLPFLGVSDCTTTIEKLGGDTVYRALQAASGRYENVETVNFDDLVCPDGVCSATRGDNIVFRDSHHLTDKFVRLLAPEIQKLTAMAPSTSSLEQ